MVLSSNTHFKFTNTDTDFIISLTDKPNRTGRAYNSLTQLKNSLNKVKITSTLHESLSISEIATEIYKGYNKKLGCGRLMDFFQKKFFKKETERYKKTKQIDDLYQEIIKHNNSKRKIDPS